MRHNSVFDLWQCKHSCMDSSCSEIKRRRDNDETLVAQFEKDDDLNYPAWLFCVTDIIDAYGLCPHLTLSEKHLRSEWLSKTHDKGVLYDKLRKRLIDKEGLQKLQVELDSSRAHLEKLVKDCLVDSGLTYANGYSSPVEYIIEETRIFKATKSRSKAVRDRWKDVVTFVENAYEKVGINLCKYQDLVHGMTLKVPLPSVKQVNQDFDTACEAFVSARRLLTSEDSFVIKQREDAVRKLSNFIQGDFAREQVGRYFKRWTMLSLDQQRERIESFASWKAKTMDIPNQHISELVDLVINGLQSKTLKCSALQWSSKTGVIDDITGLEWKSEGDCEDTKQWVLGASTLSKKGSVGSGSLEKKSVTFATENSAESPAGDEVPPPRRRRPPTGATRKACARRKSGLDEEDEARLNRLLLLTLVSQGQPLEKSQIIKTVTEAYSTNATVRGKCLPYVSTTYDKWLPILRDNPMVSNGV